MRVIYSVLVLALALLLLFWFWPRSEILVEKAGLQALQPVNNPQGKPPFLTDPENLDLDASVGDLLQNFDLSPRSDARPLWTSSEDDRVVTIQRAVSISARRVYMDDAVLSLLEPGDSFIMQIPQSARLLSATVLDRKMNTYSTTLFATVDGSKGLFHAQVTFSGASIFAEVETPEGIFILEKQAGQTEDEAFIYNQAEIYQHMNYAESDAIPLEFRPEVVLDAP